MGVIEAGHVGDHHVVEVEVVLGGGDFLDPRADVQEVETDGIALPLVGSVVLVVDTHHVHEVGHLLVQGELAEGAGCYERKRKILAELVHVLPPIIPFPVKVLKNGFLLSYAGPDLAEDLLGFSIKQNHGVISRVQSITRSTRRSSRLALKESTSPSPKSTRRFCISIP